MIHSIAHVHNVDLFEMILINVCDCRCYGTIPEKIKEKHTGQGCVHMIPYTVASLYVSFRNSIALTNACQYLDLQLRNTWFTSDRIHETEVSMPLLREPPHASPEMC